MLDRVVCMRVCALVVVLVQCLRPSDDLSPRRLNDSLAVLQRLHYQSGLCEDLVFKCKGEGGKEFKWPRKPLKDSQKRTEYEQALFKKTLQNHAIRLGVGVAAYGTACAAGAGIAAVASGGAMAPAGCLFGCIGVACLNVMALGHIVDSARESAEEELEKVRDRTIRCDPDQEVFQSIENIKGAPLAHAFSKMQDIKITADETLQELDKEAEAFEEKLTPEELSAVHCSWLDQHEEPVIVAKVACKCAALSTFCGADNVEHIKVTLGSRTQDMMC
eukprot:TRINITY_DN39359_c0_g1_i1.p1 TRINITY_DN39359_c0_g1~~TRINITY_DN39359_c0_g1_i1.p1  ORF type:complete len:275 (-),score=24.01 TRINITY_DN39359_c0_g1_i1:488-1312(-)